MIDVFFEISSKKLERWLANHLGLKRAQLETDESVHAAILKYLELENMSQSSNMLIGLEGYIGGYLARYRLHLRGDGEEFRRVCQLLEKFGYE